MNSVLRKARLILEAFSADDESVSLTELVRRTGVAKATVYRLGQELLQWGLLERNGNEYRLGLHLFELGQRVHRQRILREAALPFMEDLLVGTRETIHFAIHDGLSVLYLEKIIMHRGLSQHSRVAGRLPLYCTATGKVILAFGAPELIDAVAQAGLVPMTRHTIASLGVLTAQVQRARTSGMAAEFEETRLGYASVAVPVFGADHTLAGGIAVTAPTSRMQIERFVRALRAAAHGISEQLRSMG